MNEFEIDDMPLFDFPCMQYSIIPIFRNYES